MRFFFSRLLLLLLLVRALERLDLLLKSLELQSQRLCFILTHTQIKNIYFT